MQKNHKKEEITWEKVEAVGRMLRWKSFPSSNFLEWFQFSVRPNRWKMKRLMMVITDCCQFYHENLVQFHVQWGEGVMTFLLEKLWKIFRMSDKQDIWSWTKKFKTNLATIWIFQHQLMSNEQEKFQILIASSRNFQKRQLTIFRIFRKIYFPDSDDTGCRWVLWAYCA